MPKLKLTLEYDGTDFVGWQVQPNGRTVQEELEKALRVLLGHDVRVVGAGRTDSGVHATGQVASFRAERSLPRSAYLEGLNGILPHDVAVVDVEEVPEAFCARRWASAKRYVYRISNRPVRSPLRRRTHWEIFRPLDVASMREAAAHFLGRHDFSAFRAADCTAPTTVRELFRLDVLQEDEEIRFVFEATAFLKQMVRNIVGTLVEVGLGKRPPDDPIRLLALRDRRLAGETAPAHGLTLERVWYNRFPRSDIVTE
ncbi:MAG: tRNA pseudouridine(38-40) synthase TruA [Pseudomonadota bacterium]|nr:MAG: tRNA pseudouridine(38-40) synthase TruA [Pseudomonadota bacterium]